MDEMDRPSKACISRQRCAGCSLGGCRSRSKIDLSPSRSWKISKAILSNIVIDFMEQLIELATCRVFCDLLIPNVVCPTVQNLLEPGALGERQSIDCGFDFFDGAHDVLFYVPLLLEVIH